VPRADAETGFVPEPHICDAANIVEVVISVVFGGIAVPFTLALALSAVGRSDATIALAPNAPPLL
jgi:hypothetical protein